MCRPISSLRSIGLRRKMRPWVHDVEGPDDMPAHVKAMLNGVSLHVPVAGGRLALGTWQGIYLVEHRRRPHSREIIFQFIGGKK